MAHVVDFDTWNLQQLKEFVGFNTGRDLRFTNSQPDLCFEAKQIYKADPQTLTKFGDFIRSGGKVPEDGFSSPSGRFSAPSVPPPVQYGAYPPAAGGGAFAPPAPHYQAPPYQPTVQQYPSTAPTYPAAGIGQSPYHAPAATAAPTYPAAGVGSPSYPAPAAVQSAYPPASVQPSYGAGSAYGGGSTYTAYPAAAPPAVHVGSKATAPAYGLSPQPATNGVPQYAAAQFQAQQHQHAPPPQQQQQQQPEYKHLLAQPERRRKALLIGCNYPGTSAELRGCVNDAKCMEYLLTTKFGFRPENIRVLRDDREGGRSPSILPTRANIMRNIAWLVGGNAPGDSLFFHFSGHGSQARDYSGREADGKNETICPCDFERAGQIVDDELNAAMVRTLVRGATLHAVIDACHSGTAMDLPFVTKKTKGSGQLAWVMDSRPARDSAMRGLVVQFGACTDSQTAADTSQLSNAHTGAATFMFIQAVEKLSQAGAHNITYSQVISEMWKEIEKVNGPRASGGGGLVGGLLGALVGAAAGGGGVSSVLGALSGANVRGQTPQLSSSENFNLDLPLML